MSSAGYPRQSQRRGIPASCVTALVPVALQGSRVGCSGGGEGEEEERGEEEGGGEQEEVGVRRVSVVAMK